MSAAKERVAATQEEVLQRGEAYSKDFALRSGRCGIWILVGNAAEPCPLGIRARHVRKGQGERFQLYADADNMSVPDIIRSASRK
jgi:hypothetical protein